jgi:ABC-type amino acid transport substrate-binding protein
MMLVGVALLSALLGALGGGNFARAQSTNLMDQVLNRKELRVGVELKYPPIMYRDKNGTPQGFEVDMARAMCKDLDVRCVFVDTEFPALIPGLAAHKFDIIVAQMAITPVRAKVVYFCKPFEATGDVVVVSAKSPLSLSANAETVISALNKPNVKFATQISTVESQMRQIIFPNTQNVDVNGPLDAFLQVVSGRADATLSDDVSALNYAKEHPGTIKVLLDGRHQPFLRNFPSGGGVLRGEGEFCHWVDIAVQDWINAGDYRKTYLKDVGWEPPLQQLELARGQY